MVFLFYSENTGRENIVFRRFSFRFLAGKVAFDIVVCQKKKTSQTFLIVPSSITDLEIIKFRIIAKI